MGKDRKGIKKVLNGSYKKAEKLLEDTDELTFRLNRVLKNLRWCREGCKETAELIGDMNGEIESRRGNARKAS
jgi:predicted RNA-binding protein with EMAP domain